jgi:lipoprotein-anchoring transpeptidase ErfK/SrfK
LRGKTGIPANKDSCKPWSAGGWNQDQSAMTMQNPNRFAPIAAAILVLLMALACEPDTSFARTLVSKQGVNAGTILVRTGERRLYFGVGGGKAIQYRVGVGRSDRQWTGRRFISGKALKPAWRPTAEIRRDKPNIAAVIPSGAPENPMGAAALLISGEGQYAIHGTNKPGSIGGFVSYGCIRMLNEDVLDLYSRVWIGTPVIVTD